MATFRKRSGKWQVQVRRDGAPPLSKTFLAKRDAEAWAREIEARIERGEPVEGRVAPSSIRLADLLTRYEREVTPSKRSAPVERYRIGRMLRNELAVRFAQQITTEMIGAYRDERLGEVSGETVRQDLVLLRQVYEVARREWGLPIARNPVDDVRKPKASKPRTRRVTTADLDMITPALAKLRNPLVKEVVAFALATGMRRGEILRVDWRAVDRTNSILSIPITKNGHSRIIPLTSEALAVLDRVRQFDLPGDLAFPISANAFKLAWRRVLDAAGIDDLRFHDCRHEALTGFFEVGLSLPEVQLISGHRDPRQLMRYTHLQAANVAKKLAGRREPP